MDVKQPSADIAGAPAIPGTSSHPPLLVYGHAQNLKRRAPWNSCGTVVSLFLAIERSDWEKQGFSHSSVLQTTNWSVEFQLFMWRTDFTKAHHSSYIGSVMTEEMAFEAAGIPSIARRSGAPETADSDCRQHLLTTESLQCKARNLAAG